MARIDKTKDELLREISDLREHIAELEKIDAERKNVEAILRQTEEKYRNIYENATEGIFQTSTDGRFISANPSLARIHGYSSPEDLIKSITNIARQLYVNPADRFKLLNLLNMHGAVQNHEVQMYRKDGSLQWILMNVREVRDSAGTLLYYEGTMQDITRRKKAEAALIESEERYRTAIEHSNDGVAIIHENKHQYVNKRFVEMFEYDTPDDIIGKPITFVAHPDDKEKLISINNSRQKNQYVPSRYEFKGITKTGKSIFIEVSAATIPSRGTFVYLVYLRDITERIQAHEALIRSRNELEKLNRAKTKAVNHISHELKTPLSVIQGNIRLLKRKLDNTHSYQTVKGLMESLERNLERLLNISRETDMIFSVSQELEVGSTLDELERLWQRIEGLSDIPRNIRTHWNVVKEWMNQYITGSAHSFQLIDLYSFILSIVEKAKNTASHRVINIEVEGQNDLFFYMDPVIMGDIGEGLIKNAIENTPDGGRIKISAEQQNDRVLLRVIDTGVGITTDNQQYLFDGLFHTKDTEMYSSKRPYDFGAGGKGLELLRMKFYAKRFGFDISLASTRCEFIPTDHDLCPGDISRCPHCRTEEDCYRSGTTFTVSFPVGRGDVKDGS